MVGEHDHWMGDDWQTAKVWTLERDGIILKGETDFYHKSGIIEDAKKTSVWAFIYKRALQKWIEQLNIYAYLIEKNGYPVNNLVISAFLRDWSAFESMKRGNWSYPKGRYHKIAVPLWTMDEREEFVTERIKLHLSEPIPCNTEVEGDRWSKPTTAAIMKQGRKSALIATNKETSEKIKTKAEALEVIKTNNLYDDYVKGIVYVEERPGEDTRCQTAYCLAAEFCPYRRK